LSTKSSKNWDKILASLSQKNSNIARFSPKSGKNCQKDHTYLPLTPRSFAQDAKNVSVTKRPKLGIASS
jgi:regulatory protein YycH of two-component signal transduction system YycFG